MIFSDRFSQPAGHRVIPLLGPAVFGEGDTELSKAALTGLAKKHKLFVAADEATGHLLEARIRGEQEAAAVYDFGDHSYRHPTKADRL